jgi:PAS domain S-box-containing protein
MSNGIGRIHLFALAFLFAMFLLSGCERGDVVRFSDPIRFSTLEEIPGITREDIEAIEALRETYDYFIFGMPISTELYINRYEVLSGFSVQFCQWMTDLFGVTFVPVLYEWLDLLDGMASGEIHFSGELTPTAARREEYKMTSAIASRTLNVFRYAGSKPFHEITSERPLLCGFIRGTATIQAVTNEMAQGTYEIIEFPNIDYIYAALQSGEIDAFFYSEVMDIHFINYENIVVSNFFPLIFMPVSLMTRISELEPVITIVEKILNNGGLHYLTTMYNQAHREYQRFKLYSQFTEEERAFIIEQPSVNIGVDPANYPGCFFDFREGKWAGMFLDVLDEISALTGLAFVRVNDEFTEWPEIYAMLKSGEISLVPELTHSLEWGDQFIWPETAMMTDYYTLISHIDFPNIEINEVLYTRVGLTQNTTYTTIFNKWFPGHVNTRTYENISDAFAALRRGEVDMVMASEKRLLYLTHYLELPYYKINIAFDYPIDIKIGINRDEMILRSIIDRALNMVDYKGIIYHWMSRTYDYRSQIAEAQRPLWIGLSVLLACVLILIAVLLVRSVRSGKRLKTLVAERTHDLSLQSATLLTLFDSIPDFIFVKDMDLKYVQCNKSMLAYFNRSRESIIGKTDLTGFGFSEKEADLFNEWDRRVIDERRMNIIEEILLRSDGAKMLFEVIKTPLIVNNEPVGVLGIARDVTRRKEMEEAALAASRSKSEFLAKMSHEIRTPMNSIIGFSELALDNDMTPKTKDYLTKILDNSEWLLQIINDILDIAKIESGKIELDSVPIDIHELFIRCQTMIKPKADAKKLLLHFYAEPFVDKMPLGDPQKLLQILLNLLTNAVKFTHTGTVSLKAIVRDITGETVSLYFEIKDSGIGMSPEQTAKIFDPFIQAETGTTRKYGGTGLGLSITKNLVEMMGGKLELESTPGIGSKFGFELTFNVITVETGELPEKQSTLSVLEKPTFEGEVLVCEDNAMNQQVIREHLARVGLKAVMADNGQIGVDLVKKRFDDNGKPFNLIFMDIHMPVMDGLEATKIILGLGIGTPIVAMTANIMYDETEFYKTSGMNDCIGKPFTSQELWKCLLKYFEPVTWQQGNASKAENESDGLQQRLVDLFVANNPTKTDEIVEALNANDIKLAHRLVHTLKNNAGQLKLEALQKIAEEIERCLMDGTNHTTPRQIEKLSFELNAALNELATQVSIYPHPATERDYLDTEEAKVLLDALEPLLKNFDSTCLTLVDKLRMVRGGEILVRHMQNIDFVSALKALTELKKNPS